MTGMHTGAARAFARRFYRGLETPEPYTFDVGFVDVRCSICSSETMDYADAKDPLCFRCSNATNPYAEKGIMMSVDASCDPSTNPSRIADGTSEFNMALPGVQGDAIGRDAYGQMKRKVRPLHMNEIASSRRLREMAKRANLTQLEPAKRAVGAR